MSDELTPDVHTPDEHTSDEAGNDAIWGPPGETPTVVAPTASVSGAVDDRRSRLAPPPAPPSAPAVDVATTGVVEPAPARPSWLGRCVALGAATLLIGGGGFLAINAGAADGGADSPESAFEGIFESLAAEDLIGAAQYVEPTERETMVEAGFAVVEELVRLDVFDDALDLSSVAGIDLEFTDLQMSATVVRPGVAHLFLESGEVTASIDGEAFPLGPLITDRVDADTLDVTESATTRIDPTTTPVVAVERDGRWYLSLWYTVAENARIMADLPSPDADARPAAIGGDTPERAIEDLIGAAVDMDLAAMVGMLDPQEAAALYDYAPLFLGDAQDTVDESLAQLRDDGWQWDASAIELRSDTDGDLATVYVDGMSFDASGPEGTLAITYSQERTSIQFDSDEVTVEVLAEGDCVDMTFDDGGGVENESFCTSDMLENEGLTSLGGGAFANLQSMTTPGIVVREVDGRWYVSPLRTGFAITLDVLRTIEPETLAETIDALVAFAEDPFGVSAGSFDSGFGSSVPFSDDLYGDDGTIPSTTTAAADAEYQFSTDNVGLLAPAFDVLFAYDLTGPYSSDLWVNWLDDADGLTFDQGVTADVYLGDDNLNVAVLTGVGFADNQALAEWLGAALIVDGDLSYVRGATDWGGDYAVARLGDTVVVVGAWDGWSDAIPAALRAQRDG